MQKAYKLLSTQLGTSHKKAKTLIDQGRVSFKGKKITLARAEFPDQSIFDVIAYTKPTILFEDSDIMCIDKPPFIESYNLVDDIIDIFGEEFKEWSLLHRLDKETSGVILLVKTESEFAKKAREEFKHKRVIKHYNTLVDGIISEEQVIDLPILTQRGKIAKSKISKKGLPAISIIKPQAIIGKKTLLDVEIKTGRTHQIRIHLKAIGYPIVGDSLYGGIPAKRLMLHARYIKIFDYEFHAPLPKEFQV